MSELVRYSFLLVHVLELPTHEDIAHNPVQGVTKATAAVAWQCAEDHGRVSIAE